MIRLKGDTVPPLTGGGQQYVHVELGATEQKFPNVFVAGLHIVNVSDQPLRK